MSGKDKEIYSQQFNWLRGQIQPLSDQLKSAGAVANLMGYKKGGSSLEIEKLRIGHERWQSEESWKHEAWRAEQMMKEKTEKNRWDAILTIGTKWMDKISPILDAGVGGAVKHITGNPNQPSNPAHSGVINISCVECKTPIPIIGDPPFVKCPNCGLVHNKNVEASKPVKNVDNTVKKSGT